MYVITTISTYNALYGMNDPYQVTLSHTTIPYPVHTHDLIKMPNVSRAANTHTHIRIPRAHAHTLTHTYGGQVSHQ